MRKPGVERLRVLRALFPAPVDDRPDGHWGMRLTAEHRRPFGCLVDDGVERVKHEIDPRMDHYRPVPGQGGAYRRAGPGEVRYRGVDHRAGAELLVGAPQ